MSGLFKELSPEETKEYQQWARDNFKVGDKINEVWHPVVQSECSDMETEAFEKIASFILDESDRPIPIGEIVWLLRVAYTDHKATLTFNEVWGEVLNGN